MKKNIYIDNTGHDIDAKLGLQIKNRILRLKSKFDLEVLTFTDLPKERAPEDDDNEENTLKAINNADIVIPVVTSVYTSYVSEKIEKAMNAIIASNDRYLFPLLVDETDWSNYDWLVKSNMIPDHSQPLSNFTDSQKEIFIKNLTNSIEEVLVQYNQEKDSPKKAVTQNNHSIFISHDHDDADFAELLKLKLEKEGINSWLDSEKLKVGQDWREEIDTGIENSIALIVVMTPEARQSEYVTYEWAYAWGKGIKIFPIMLKQTQLHPRLESLQYLNFTNNPTRPWDDLIKSIKKIDA